jgi:hypothetical protein
MVHESSESEELFIVVSHKNNQIAPWHWHSYIIYKKHLSFPYAIHKSKYMKIISIIDVSLKSLDISIK